MTHHPSPSERDVSTLEELLDGLAIFDAHVDHDTVAYATLLDHLGPQAALSCLLSATEALVESLCVHSGIDVDVVADALRRRALRNIDSRLGTTSDSHTVDGSGGTGKPKG